MTTITFDNLFDIMLAELPVITNATCLEDVFAWTSRHHDDERRVFLERLGHSVLVVAQKEGRDKVESHHITDVNRTRVRARFEEELDYGLTHLAIGYTERDIELVNEYLRTGYATTTKDAASKKK